jgi:hypothetical protein
MADVNRAMLAVIVTKNVYLDTSAIVQQNFDYASAPFKRLVDLAQAGDAQLLTTTITQLEVEANIRERLREASTALDRFRNRHAILKNLADEPFKPLFGTVDLAAIEQSLVKQYRDFLDRAAAQFIPLSVASAEDVFYKYFEREPPFGDGKKKSEFPDAFVMSALENWCAARGEKIYVVSTDPDIIAHCETSDRLVHLNRPSEYVDLVLRQNAALQAVEESTSRKSDVVARAIAKGFEDLGFYIDDAEGDVAEVSVTKVEIDEFSLLDVVDRRATFEVVAAVRYAAKVIYDDMDTAVWDSEDKVLIPMHRINTEVEGSVDIAATMEVDLDEEDRFRSISSIKLPDSDVGITVLPDQWEH